MINKLIFDVATMDIDQFRRSAEKAKALGATHMMVGHLPRSRWMWEKDLKDPIRIGAWGMPSFLSSFVRRSLRNTCLWTSSTSALQSSRSAATCCGSLA